MPDDLRKAEQRWRRRRLFHRRGLGWWLIVSGVVLGAALAVTAGLAMWGVIPDPTGWLAGGPAVAGAYG